MNASFMSSGCRCIIVGRLVDIATFASVSDVNTNIELVLQLERVNVVTY